MTPNPPQQTESSTTTSKNDSESLYPTKELLEMEKKSHLSDNCSEISSDESGNEPDNESNTTKDLKLLQNILRKRFTGNEADLRTFLDQAHYANEICHPSKKFLLNGMIINQIEGEPWERIRQRSKEGVTWNFPKLKKFLREQYEPKETFEQALSNLIAIKQTPKETVREYAERINTLSYLAHLAAEREDEEDL